MTLNYFISQYFQLLTQPSSENAKTLLLRFYFQISRSWRRKERDSLKNYHELIIHK